MAYVRKRGNQLAVVHGTRDRQTRKVIQQTLFTFYSQAEAREALGQGSDRGRRSFRFYLEQRHPRIRFDWRKIDAQLEDNLDHLPDTPPDYHEERARKGFRDDLTALTRQLLLAEPSWHRPAAELVKSHRYELEYLVELIQSRLKHCDHQPNEWNRDNAFLWRYEMRDHTVPPDLEERAESLLEGGQLDRAEAIFGLFVDCFEDYAEGHNYLGLIALRRGDLEAAREHFERTVEVGRRLFPTRMAKRSYWNDFATRPYMRGLRNLTITFNRAGQYEEALRLCSQLQDECGDDHTAASLRAAIYLNSGRYHKAAEEARRLHEIWPSQCFIVAFALVALGEPRQALPWLLRAALTHPRAARILLVECQVFPEPQGFDEVSDHNAGVTMWNSLKGYFATRPPEAEQFFTDTLQLQRVRALTHEVEETRRLLEKAEGSSDRGHLLRRVKEMGSLDHAQKLARDVAPLLFTSNGTGALRLH